MLCGRSILVLCLAACFVAAASSARADLPPFSQAQEKRPVTNAPLQKLEGVGMDQRLGNQIPLDLVFKDEAGKPVKLGQYFDGKKPVVLTLVYYGCPMLCTMVLNDLNRSLNGLNLSAGDDFQIVTVSFDPREGPKEAADKKATYMQSYRRPHAEEGWHFLTGDEATIHQLTEAVGFHYKFDEKFQQYIHPSGITLLTPTGVISRYFFGIDYGLKDLKLSLQEASGNKIGSLTDQILLYCFHYDETTGKYSLMVVRMVQVGAVMTLMGLGAFWFTMFRRERTMTAKGATEAKEEQPLQR
jgi:protein SCO1/2